MRKVLTLVIISVFTLILLNIKNLIVFDEAKIKLSKFSLFKKKITKISLINNKNTSKNYLLRLLNIENINEFSNYNRNKIKKKLEQINEIDSFMFELKEDGHLIVNIIEKKPLMVWINNGKRSYIDGNGLILKYSKVYDQDLIEVFGDKSLISFKQLTALLNNRKKFASSVKQMVVKNDGSWLFILKDNKCVNLLTKKLDKVLNIFEDIKILEVYDNFSYFDMRIHERIYLSNKQCSI
tara:strand:+ start:618 stop:1331 length:714 start_codon:yes stop_codon:yes gene_type:complete